MDLFLGRGVYLFPNFRNWPLLFSRSFTYIHDVAFARHPETVEPRNLAYLRKNVARWIGRTTNVVTVSETSKAGDRRRIRRRPVEDRGRPQRGRPDAVPAQRCRGASKPRRGISASPGSTSSTSATSSRARTSLRLIDAYTSLPKSLTDTYQLVMVGSGGWLNEEIMRRHRPRAARRLPHRQALRVSSRTPRSSTCTPAPAARCCRPSTKGSACRCSSPRVRHAGGRLRPGVDPRGGRRRRRPTATPSARRASPPR